MRKLSIGAARSLVSGSSGYSSSSLAACGGSSTSSTPSRTIRRAGGSLRNRPDREELPPGDVAEGHRPDDEPVGPERDVHDRTGQTAAGKEQIRTLLARRSEVVQAREQLGLGHRRPTRFASRSTATGARCTSSATTSTRRRDKVDGDHGADQQVARIDGKWLITNMVGDPPRSAPDAVVGASAGAGAGPAIAGEPAVEPGRQSLSSARSAACRSRFTPSCWSRSWHRGAGRRGRPARAARPRPVEREGGDGSGALQKRAARVRQAPERRAASSSAPRGERRARTSTSSTPGALRAGSRRAGRSRVDLAVANALTRIAPATLARPPRIRASRRGRTRSFARSGGRAIGSRR